jgi:hypothetical protein
MIVQELTSLTGTLAQLYFATTVGSTSDAEQGSFN